MARKIKRFLSVFLSLVLCILYYNGIPAYAVEDVEASNKPQINEAETIVENIETEKLILSDTFMSYIDESEFKSHNFTNRLTEQEKLNTYVFQNADKTTSVYYFSENLKYIDDSGNVVEKDLSLIEAKDGYTINKSDMDILLPNTLTSGISVGYDDFSISITPITASKMTSTEKIKAEKSDGTVVYNGIFGENTKLVYTPILSGLKEDIILSEYVANAEFSFTIKTGGLRIVEKDGGYYIASAEKSEPIFNLGDVIVYDAVGKPSVGKMTVKTINDSSEYIVTMAADENFLKDAGTVYPVTIDPTITISDNTNGKGAIEDAPIYQGYPNTNFGTYIFNPVGTPAEEYGVGYTVVRLTALISSAEYLNTSSDNITNVTFHVKEGSGRGSQFVFIAPMTSNTTWTESTVTWNNVGSYMPLINNGATLYGGQWTGFNLTNLVKAWKSGTYPANAGFVMATMETGDNSTFLSSEYPTTSYRPYVVMTYESAIKSGTVYMIKNASTNLYLKASDEDTLTLDIGNEMDGKQLWYVVRTGNAYRIYSMGIKAEVPGASESMLCGNIVSESPKIRAQSADANWTINYVNGYYYLINSSIAYNDTSLSVDSSNNYYVTHTLHDDANLYARWIFEEISISTFNNYFTGGYNGQGSHVYIKISADSSLYENNYADAANLNAVNLWNGLSSNVTIYDLNDVVPSSIDTLSVTYFGYTPTNPTQNYGRTQAYKQDLLWYEEVSLAEDFDKVEIFINTSSLSPFASETTDVVVEKVIVHELGHGLKLAHPMEPNGLLPVNNARNHYLDNETVYSNMNQGNPNSVYNLTASTPKWHDIINLRNKWGG